MVSEASTDTTAADRIVLENDTMRVALCVHTGQVLQIENCARGLHLIHHSPTGPPWRIEVVTGDEPTRWLEHDASFDWSIEENGAAARLRWQLDSGIVLSSQVSLLNDEGGVAFTVAITGVPDLVIDKIEYPILTGIGDLHDRADSMLAHSQGTGFLFRRPYHLFESEPLRQQGLRYSPYPEGFNGSTMQFFAYYAEGIGGYLMRTLDSTGAMKWFNFYKDASETLASTFMHQAPDMQPGADFDISYPIVIEPLTEGTWYEAADRYRRWAAAQPWTARGALADRTDRPTWLLDDVGFATFGVNAAHDRSGWLDRFHAITDAPVFHVLGVNWPKEPTGYGRGHPGGRDDWFPAQFSDENLEAIARNGDYWAPFEFDLLLDPDKAESDRVLRNQLKLPEEKYSFDQYRFPFQCPATDYLPALHQWRDAELAGTYGADALYYDISANNVLMTCRDPDHGHPVGGGAWMVDAIRRMWEATGAAASAAKGEHVPQGAEMISELFISSLDYYQARAEASPLSAFEADVFRAWIRDGSVEKIPLFTYVYHEYGPVRMDGWAKLARETGDLWYWVASRVSLWGGLFELNYEFSDLEALDGFEDDPTEHYADFERRAYDVDRSRVAFVREIARARTGFAKPWLVYGRMMQPLPLDIEPIELDYHLYNVNARQPHYDETGSMRVDSIIHAAWRAPDGRVGFAFVNLKPDMSKPLALRIDPERYGLPPDTPYRLRRVTNDTETDLGSARGAATVKISLAPRQLTLVELARAAPDKEG